jgi:fatty acid-binding protein DegV
LTICTGGAPEVDELRELLAARYSGDEILVRDIGPVIGAHGGPRVIGLSWVDAV